MPDNKSIQNGVAGAMAGLTRGPGRRLTTTTRGPDPVPVNNTVDGNVDTKVDVSTKRLQAKKRAPERVNVAYRIKPDTQARFLAWCDARGVIKGEALELAMELLMQEGAQ